MDPGIDLLCLFKKGEVVFVTVELEFLWRFSSLLFNCFHYRGDCDVTH